LERGVVIVGYSFTDQLAETIRLIRRYADTPMSLADACLVHMTEALADPVLLTTATDFRIYRRRNRQTVPCVMPG
jgi:predicted nucleic acid-binding protein